MTGDEPHVDLVTSRWGAFQAITVDEAAAVSSPSCRTAR